LTSRLFVGVGRDNMRGLRWAYCTSVYDDRSLWNIGVMIICRGEPSEIWSFHCMPRNYGHVPGDSNLWKSKYSEKNLSRCHIATVPTGPTLIIKPRLGSAKEPSYVCSGWFFRVVVKD